MKQKTYIIAEAGVNHNGDIDKAFELIDIAENCGADAVKFQLFSTNKLVTKYADKAEYQLKHSSEEKQYKMLSKLELPKNIYNELHNYSIKKNIDFLCTAFDEENVDFLVKEKLVKILKIGSGEITNAPLLLFHAQTNFSIILSTGMSTIMEIQEALGVIAFGLLNNKKSKPSIEKFRECFFSTKGKEILKKKVTLLHCTTEYPAPLNELNLKAIESMRNYFNLEIGFSDHSNGIEAASAAVLLGAKIIEKHFTINNNNSSPDHKASLEPAEFKKFILKIRKLDNKALEKKFNYLKSIKNIDIMLGDGIKEAKKSEIKNINIARRFLVAKTDISFGEIFTKNNIDCKRSKKGISPFFYWKFLGRKSNKKYYKDEIISLK